MNREEKIIKMKEFIGYKNKMTGGDSKSKCACCGTEKRILLGRELRKNEYNFGIPEDCIGRMFSKKGYPDIVLCYDCAWDFEMNYVITKGEKELYIESFNSMMQNCPYTKAGLAVLRIE